MRIGLDIDGTITAHPEHYREFSRRAMAAGDEIWIITGVGELAAREHQLAALGIAWNRIEIVDNGSPPDVLGPIKARFCLENSIDVMIDDMLEVVAACMRAGVLAFISPPASFQ